MKKFVVMCIHFWSHHDWTNGWSYNSEAYVVGDIIYADAEPASKAMLEDYESKRKEIEADEDKVETSFHGLPSLRTEAVLKYNDGIREDGYSWKIVELTENRKEDA